MATRWGSSCRKVIGGHSRDEGWAAPFYVPQRTPLPFLLCWLVPFSMLLSLGQSYLAPCWIAESVAKVKELGDGSKSDLWRAAGYVSTKRKDAVSA